MKLSLYKTNNQRGSLIIILTITILLVIVGGGAYYLGSQNTKQSPGSPTTGLSPTPQIMTNSAPDTGQDTVNWKTYTNNDMGFSIQYPDGWLVEDSFSSSVTIYNGERLETEPNSPIDPYPVSLNISLRNGSSAQEACNAETCQNVNNVAVGTNYKLENVKTGNVTGIRVINLLVSHTSGDYYLSGNGKVVRLGYGTHEPEAFASNKEIFEKMLSTFKFIN